MATVFIWSISGPLFYGSNLYIIGKKMCCLYCPYFCFVQIVFKEVKLQVISSCSEQNIFSLVTKCFNIFQYFFQDWFTDFSHIYWILPLWKHVPKELSLQMMKNSEYSNSTLPNSKLRSLEVLHFRQELCKRTVQRKKDTGK